MKIADLQAQAFELVDRLFSQYLSVETSQAKCNASTPTISSAFQDVGSPSSIMIILGVTD